MFNRAFDALAKQFRYYFTYMSERERLLVEDRSCADNHCFAADPNFLENSCTARERNVNTTRAAHADALKVH